MVTRTHGGNGLEETATVDATGTESSASGTTQATTPDVTASGEATPPGASTTQLDDAFWARLSEIDPDEIIRRNPRVQGKVGALAQRQSDQARRQAEQEFQGQLASIRDARATEDERARLRQLATTDPDKLAEATLTKLAMDEFNDTQRKMLSDQQAQMSQALAGQLNRFYERPLFQEVWEQADADTRAKLSWTNYQDIPSFFEAAAEIITDFRSEKKASTLANKRLEALQKDAKLSQVTADADAGQPGANLDGLSNAGHVFTQAEVSAMDMPTFSKNKSVINAQYAAGLIR